MAHSDDSLHCRRPFGRRYRDELLDFVREHRTQMALPHNRERMAGIDPEDRAEFRRVFREDIYGQMKEKFVEMEAFFEESRAQTAEFFLRHIKAGTSEAEFDLRLKELHLNARQLLNLPEG